MSKIFKVLFYLSLGLSLVKADDIKKNSWGIEINPLSITMLNTNLENQVFSTVVSYFDNEAGREIALSFLYAKEDGLFNIYDSPSSKTTNIALHYRNFVSQRTKGFYYGGFLSYTQLDGELKDDIRLATVKKLGLGAEIGLRIMKPNSDWSFYWGPALRIGGYFGPNNDVFDMNTIGMDLYDNRFFVDVDFMRVGFRF